MQQISLDKVTKKLKEKLKDSLGQAKKHLKLFLTINPDLTKEELKASKC